MENIGAFLEAIKKLGVPEPSLCTTADLYNGSGMPQVINMHNGTRFSKLVGHQYLLARILLLFTY